MLSKVDQEWMLFYNANVLRLHFILKTLQYSEIISFTDSSLLLKAMFKGPSKPWLEHTAYGLVAESITQWASSDPWLTSPPNGTTAPLINL